MASNTNSLIALGLKAQEGRERFTEEDSTHDPRPTNSVGQITRKLWCRYSIQLGAELNESDPALKKLVIADLLRWVEELGQSDRLSAEERASFAKERQWFSDELVKYAIREQGQLDFIFIYNPVTQATDRENIYLWQHLWCLVMAIRDDACFEEHDSDYFNRSLGLYGILKSYFINPICNTGIRNNPTQQLLHLKYRPSPNEPLVYVFTEIGTDIHHLITQYYSDKLRRYLKSDLQADRQLGYRILVQWCSGENGAEFIEFMNDERVLLDSIHHEFTVMGLNSKTNETLSLIKKYSACRNQIDTPMPHEFASTIQIVFKLISNLEWEPTVRKDFEACTELAEVQKLMGPVRRVDLLDRVKMLCDIIPFGKAEGEMLAVGRRIQESLQTPTDGEHLLTTINQLEDEFESAVVKARQDDQGSIIGNSFSVLAECQEDFIQFRDHLFDFVKRIQPIVSESRLRAMLTHFYEVKNNQGGLTLSPNATNHILWHAVLVSPAHWSPDFCNVIDRLLIALKKRHKSKNKQTWIQSSYPPALLLQIKLLLSYAHSKVIQKLPESFYMPCNLSDLTLLDVTSIHHDERENRFATLVPLLTATHHRGFWFGLPEKLTIATFIGEVRDFIPDPLIASVLAEIFTHSLPERRLAELAQCREVLDTLQPDQKNDFFDRLLYGMSSDPCKLFLLFWDWDVYAHIPSIPDVDLPHFLLTLKERNVAVDLKRLLQPSLDQLRSPHYRIDSLICLIHEFCTGDTLRPIDPMYLLIRNRFFRLVELCTRHDESTPRIAETVLLSMLISALPEIDMDFTPFDDQEQDFLTSYTVLKRELETLSHLSDKRVSPELRKCFVQFRPHVYHVGEINRCDTLLSNFLNGYYQFADGQKDASHPAGPPLPSKTWRSLAHQFEATDIFSIPESTLSTLLSARATKESLSFSAYGLTHIVLHALRISPSRWSPDFCQILMRTLVLKTRSSHLELKVLAKLQSQLQSLLRLSNLKPYECLPFEYDQLFLPFDLEGIPYSAEGIVKLGDHPNSAFFKPAIRRLINWTSTPNSIQPTYDRLGDIRELLERSPRLDRARILLINRHRSKPELLNLIGVLPEVHQHRLLPKGNDTPIETIRMRIRKLCIDTVMTIEKESRCVTHVTMTMESETTSTCTNANQGK